MKCVIVVAATEYLSEMCHNPDENRIYNKGAEEGVGPQGSNPQNRVFGVSRY